MHRSEADALSLTRCISCASEISFARDRAFAITDEDALCYACAIDRGGVYDELHDRWTKPADASGLPILS